MEQTSTRLARAFLISLFAYGFFVIASSLVWNFQGRFPTMQILFIQNLVCFLCIFPLALRNGTLKTRCFPTHLVRDLTGIASYFFYFLAIQYLNLTDATTLNYTAPFFVPIIWWIWMKEKIDIHVWWSIVIGFIGVIVILNTTSAIFEEGFLFGLFAGVLSAVALTSLRLLNLKQEPMSRILFYYFLMGALLSAPFAFLYWEQPSSLEWIEILTIGLATVIAQSLLTIAYRYGTASHLSPLGYSTVIYAAISSWLFFDTPPTARSIIGTMLIIFGGTLTYVLKKKPESGKLQEKVIDSVLVTEKQNDGNDTTME